MCNSKSWLLVLFYLIGLSYKATGTHAAGAEILYEWVNDSTYRIYYKFYRDCVGNPEPATIDLCYYSTCENVSRSVVLSKVLLLTDGTPNGSEVNPGCPGFPTKCTFSSSGLPGYREWWYTGTVTLPHRCDHWIIYYDHNNRNFAVTNLNAGGNLYVEATLNNLDFQGNTSPFFSVRPVPYICNNIPYTYNNGAYDRNDDSLSFSIMQPQTGISACAPWPSSPIPYSNPLYNITNNPLQANNTFNIDPRNGQMSFTPASIQQSVITVLVTEHRNGKVIGTVMRDIQMVVLNCNNPQPLFDINNSTVIGGSYNDTTVFGCVNQPLNFCFNAVSPLATSVLLLRDNSKTILPTASITYAGQRTDSVTGCLSWIPGISDTGLKIFTVTVIDSSCTPPGIIVSNTFTIPIFIWSQMKVDKDTAICPGDSIKLLVAGGADFVWTVLPGGSPLSSISCINCSNPTAKPQLTTRYVVESRVNPMCKNIDTVTVYVKDIPIFNPIPDQMTCINDSLLLSLSVTSVPGNATYSVRWSPSTYLDDDTSRKVYTKPYEDIQYVVTVTPDGVAACSSRDTINISVLKGYNVFNNDTAICSGDVVQINAVGDPRYSYTWTPDTGISNVNVLNPLITTDSSRTYIITARYPGCTDSVQRLQIEVQPVPTVVTHDDQTICAGDTLQLNTIVTPAYNQYSYSWTPGTGIDMPNAQNPVFSGVISGQQKIEVSTPIGCKGSDSLNIFVVNVEFLQISNDTVMCPHDSVQLHITGDSQASFYWSPNWRINDTSSNDPFVSPDRTQYYTVYAIDSTNCLDTAQVLVIVKPGAVISIPDSVTVYPGDSYHLEPETNCMYFTWFPYLGLSNPNIANPVVTPEVNTRYFVRGVTESGCIATDSIDILVPLDSEIDMPNAFAPGNGPNNILRVIHLGRATLKKFSVYNRWGVKVFETSTLSEGWDGMFNGQPQPQGVYVYVVEVQTFNGRIINKQGNITLIR